MSETKGDDVICMIKNSATLDGTLFTLHASQVHIDMPTLSEKDKEVFPSVHIHFPTSVFFAIVVTIYDVLYFYFSKYLVVIFQIISSWGVQNKIDFLSLSYTRHAEDVRQVSGFE